MDSGIKDITDLAGMAAMTTGAWLAWPSSAILHLRDGSACCKMSTSELSWMVAMMDLGNVVTPIPTSYFMDWVGRKCTLFSTAFLYLIGALLFGFGNNAWYLYVARFFVGMAKGIAFSVVPIYLAEVANIQIRGALSTMFIGFINIGLFYDYLFGSLLSYKGLIIANTSVPIIFLVTFYFVPESPYYLTMKNKKGKALESLSKFRQVAKDNDGLLSEAKLVENIVEIDLQHKGRFVDIFKNVTLRKATMIISLLALFQRGSGISPTLAYSTITLPKGGGGASINVYMIIFSFILIIANYVATPLVDTWGRKKLLIYSSLSSAVTQFVAGIFYFLQTNKYNVSGWEWLPYFCLIAFAVTYSLGIGFVPSTLVGELFPTNVKCYASSLSAIILAVTSFCVNRFFREVAESVGVEYMYIFFTVNCLASAIFCYFVLFETSGLSFHEIQDILKVRAGQGTA